MKVIKRTHNQQEAKIIVGFLQANGVDAELLDGAINSVLPIMPGGVRIAVPEDQEPKALSLLKNVEDGELSASGDHP
ncbi:MAG: putative signal transducing protein [Hyphococcus sp.]